MLNYMMRMDPFFNVMKLKAVTKLEVEYMKMCKFAMIRRF
jgi:hypothetical protein